MTKQVKSLHFTVNAESVVALCRQGWLYENKEVWARKTLGLLATGITTDQIDAVLHGISTLKSTEDGLGCFLAKEEDENWLLEIQKHRNYIESKYYTFAGRQVDKSLVDTYTQGVVRRLRDAMRLPGLLSLASPTQLMRLEEQRRQMHHQIFRDAGFTIRDIENYEGGQGSDSFCNFAIELSKFVDDATDWFTNLREKE
jgi:hypothetical protein